MERAITLVMKLMPLLFALGFLVPVIAQGIERLGWTPPLGLSPLAVGLIIGGGWGLFAQLKGRWL